MPSYLGHLAWPCERPVMKPSIHLIFPKATEVTEVERGPKKPFPFSSSFPFSPSP